MYGFPENFDISSIIGESIPQIRVGQFDLQFTIGGCHFTVESSIKVLKEGLVVGGWDGSNWPDAVFYDLMNVAVASVKLLDNRTMCILFKNGLEAVFTDDSDQYESIQITIGKHPGTGYII